MRRTNPGNRPAAPDALFEALESRQLLTIGIVTPVPDASVFRGSAPTVITLTNRYTDPQITRAVQMVTNSGTLNIAMYEGVADNTVTNFLSYVTSGAYTNNIFHRATTLANDGFAVIQAGTFRMPTGIYNQFPANAAATPTMLPPGAGIALEHPTGNTRGTIGMAHGQNVNSATSGFFFNVTNNPGFDVPTGYATFGHLYAGSLPVLDHLASFPNTDFADIPNAGGANWRPDFPLLGQSALAFGELPLRRTPVNGIVQFPIAPSDYLIIFSATQVDPSTISDVPATITVSSSNVNVATVSLSGVNLSVTPATGAAAVLGTTTITVTITGFDGTVITDTFDFTVTNNLPTAAGLQAERGAILGRNFWLNAVGVRDNEPAGVGGIQVVSFWYDLDGNGTLSTFSDLFINSDDLGTDGYRISASTLGMSLGAHRFFARIADTDGGIFVTSVIVTLSAAPATGTINPPTQTVTPGSPADVAVSGLPSDAGARRVSVFLDLNGNGSFDPLTDRDLGDARFDSGTGDWLFRVPAHQLATGINRIFVRLTDLAGNFGGIASAQITVS